MKRKISYTIALLFSSTIMVLMASCAIYSKKPLADINEVHENLLIGTWQSSTNQNNGDIYTIKDEGKYYIAEHNKNKTQHKLTLTKLNNKYFISDIYEKSCFIWMIHVDKEKLILYTLPVSAREKIFGKSDIIQISNAKLRKLCADHIDDFSVEVQKFIRIDSQFRAKKDSSQKIYYDFLKEFFACESNLPQLGNTQSEAIEFGNKLQYASEQMYTVISRYNLPETIQNAAIEYAKSVSDAGRTFRAVPYIPINEADAFWHGFFRGLGGDITGGAMEMSQWQNEAKRKLETVRSRAENLKIIMIKHGVKY